MDVVMNCEMCGREELCNDHHLIPKTNHTNKWFKKNFTMDDMKHRILMTCYDCHSAIHRFIPDEKELGKHYNTKEKLLTHPEIAKFVAWVKRQTKKVKKVQ